VRVAKLLISLRTPCAIEQGRFVFPYSPRGVRAAKLLISLRTPAHKKEGSDFTIKPLILSDIMKQQKISLPQ